MKVTIVIPKIVHQPDITTFSRKEGYFAKEHVTMITTQTFNKYDTFVKIRFVGGDYIYVDQKIEDIYNYVFGGQS